jgi:hypothetical protein
MPLIAQSYLESNPGSRVLALTTGEPGADITYNVMRTGTGDYIDSSAYVKTSGEMSAKDPNEAKLADAAAQLFSSNSSQAVTELSSIGIGGIYVPAGSSATQQSLISHVAASDGATAVVDNANGFYATLHTQDGRVGHISTIGEQEAAGDPLRIVWVVLLSVITFIYCLVAIPRFKKGGTHE